MSLASGSAALKYYLNAGYLLTRAKLQDPIPQMSYDIAV